MAVAGDAPAAAAVMLPVAGSKGWAESVEPTAQGVERVNAGDAAGDENAPVGKLDGAVPHALHGQGRADAEGGDGVVALGGGGDPTIDVEVPSDEDRAVVEDGGGVVGPLSDDEPRDIDLIPGRLVGPEDRFARRGSSARASGAVSRLVRAAIFASVVRAVRVARAFGIGRRLHAGIVDLRLSHRLGLPLRLLRGLGLGDRLAGRRLLAATAAPCQRDDSTDHDQAQVDSPHGTLRSRRDCRREARGMLDGSGIRNQSPSEARMTPTPLDHCLAARP